MPDRPAHRRFARSWAVCFTLVSLTGLLLPPTPSRGSPPPQSPIVRAVQRVRPSVVSIRGEKTVGAVSLQQGHGQGVRRVNGMGTGIVIDPRGYIVTNFHVVEGVRQIQVTTATGRQAAARLVTRDPETDLAIIKVDLPGKLPVISIGTSANLLPGETVVAVGNAYGYEHTVTRGIISALHRAVQVSDAQFYDDLIQTDASINPGNSGGPLLNTDGQMIGINVAVRAGAQGIGFSIPADKAMAIVAKLLNSPSVRKTRHGVVLAAGCGSSAGGLTVASIEKKSPAAESGLKSGDVITAVDEMKVRQELDFRRAMLERKVGEKVRLRIQRDGTPMTLQLTLADVPKPPNSPRHPAWESLGLELDPIPTKEFRRRHRTRYRGGLAITDVRPNGPAAEAGFRRGDVLVGMHVWETVSLENVSYILKRPDISSLNPVKFYILRGDKTLYGYLPVPVRTAQRP